VAEAAEALLVLALVEQEMVEMISEQMVVKLEEMELAQVAVEDVLEDLLAEKAEMD
jgi:hypothetical protein